MDVKISFALLLLAVAVVSPKKISFKSCASSSHGQGFFQFWSSRGRIVYVDVTPCDQDPEDPCVFRRGSKEKLTISFIPSDQITNGKVYANAIYKGRRFPLPLPNHDACQGYGLTCPLKSGVPAELVYNLDVKKVFPRGSYKLEALINDQNGNVVICGMIELKIA
ncbi:NPC intracellular cholesterol transporter 2 homolog a-like [Oculina patagonica]